MTVKKIILLILAACFVMTLSGVAWAKVRFERTAKGAERVFVLENARVSCSLTVDKGKIIEEHLRTRPGWSAEFGRDPVHILSNGDFSLELMWTGWRAPGKLHNADNLIRLSADNFELHSANVKNDPGGAKVLNLLFKGIDNPLEVRLSYRLGRDDFFIRRKVAVRDKTDKIHFLESIWPNHGTWREDHPVVKPGGFGKPVAVRAGHGGAFFGVEYPAATNRLFQSESGAQGILCGQEIGEKIAEEWIQSDWVVCGLTPDANIKRWFEQYLDTVRVARLRPYLLYNTWYDVRSKIYTERPEDVMNEQNLLRIIADFKREMKDKRGLGLDAFVLDDAWDVYESDWQLRHEEFPRGLAPIARALKEMGTDLGIWLGPTGGYSYRMKRIEWMKRNGYETVGEETGYNKAMMCVAGQRYKALLKKRVVDFVKNDRVAYYKWDGIQFSCSEPDHGHPVGIHSRRAAMESVIDLCNAVRAQNPDMFLNITSGTWLSPWWTKYANMIWMQGRDYGYSKVPSISKRDAAITYRDVVLYENYGKNDLWFPISNLMTHGIIKGHLQKLGGEAEPLDKFTDNAVLYFARGVTMWELYVSPNLLNDSEWDAVASSVRWAKDRFDTLKSTEMIGGNPGENQAYGYAHFSGQKGIVAARNPFIDRKSMKVTLAQNLGLDPKASSLVLERIYPTRWISPKLYKAGDTVDLVLDGYQTAIYEIYPLDQAATPLLAGVTFDVVKASKDTYTIEIYQTDEKARLLNPNPASRDFHLTPMPAPKCVKSGVVVQESNRVHTELQVVEPAVRATLAILFEPDKTASGIDPSPAVLLDGEKVSSEVEQQEGGGWKWLKIDLGPGKHRASLELTPAMRKWKGKVSFWAICDYRPEAREITLVATQKIRPRPALPRPYPAGVFRKNEKIGSITLK